MQLQFLDWMSAESLYQDSYVETSLLFFMAVGFVSHWSSSSFFYMAVHFKGRFTSDYMTMNVKPWRLSLDAIMVNHWQVYDIDHHCRRLQIFIRSTTDGILLRVSRTGAHDLSMVWCHTTSVYMNDGSKWINSRVWERKVPSHSE